MNKIIRIREKTEEFYEITTVMKGSLLDCINKMHEINNDLINETIKSKNELIKVFSNVVFSSKNHIITADNNIDKRKYKYMIK